MQADNQMNACTRYLPWLIPGSEVSSPSPPPPPHPQPRLISIYILYKFDHGTSLSQKTNKKVSFYSPGVYLRKYVHCLYLYQHI